MHELTNLGDLEAALARASTHPVLFFKHSSTCGISAQAHEEILALLADSAWPTEVCVVFVPEGRLVSNEIAKRLNVRHASPQVLLVQSGVVLWHASHFRVTAQAIRAALQRGAAPTPASAPTLEAGHRSFWRWLGAWRPG
ncbi:MAG: bacillithiol system redox-active protein YtxJ [Vicinamibacterales bacterium]